ncbi:MAG TPA: hypothetical protein PLQ35_03915 [bacterium]|mgnify:CR=1 FL=1|nr:hypothetical protein [bacterium]HQL61418.1 hypothetical protein [bacterium]
MKLAEVLCLLLPGMFQPPGIYEIVFLLVIYPLMLFIPCCVLYYLIRLAVRHGIRDVIREQGKMPLPEKRED